MICRMRGFTWPIKFFELGFNRIIQDVVGAHPNVVSDPTAPTRDPKTLRCSALLGEVCEVLVGKTYQIHNAGSG